MTKLSIEDLDAIRERGNYLVTEKKFNKAIDAYAKGLMMFDEHKIEELSQEQLELKAKLAANQAHCYVLTNDYEKCVSACNTALQCNPFYRKALFRRASAYEKLEQPSEAMLDLRELLRIDPKNEEIIEASRRVGIQIKQDWEIKQTFHSHVKQIVQNPKCDRALHISMVINKLGSSETYHKPVCTSGFVEKLQTIILDRREAPQDKVLAIKGLRSTFAILKNSSPKLKVICFEGFIQNLIGLMRYGNGVEDEEMSSELELHCSLMLATLSTDNDFAPLDGDYLTVVAESFLEFFVASTVAKKSACSFSRLHYNRIDHTLKAIAYMAMSSPKALEVCLSKCLAQILMAELADDVELQHSIVSCLVALSAKVEEDQPNKSNEGGSADDAKKAKKSKKKCKDKKPDAPVKSLPTDYQGICDSWIKRFLMADADAQISKGLRALSLVLRASPQVGFQILNEQKILQKVVDLSESDCENKLLSAEVLALGSTDTSIRRAITTSGNCELFFSLLKTEDPAVRSHACLALSKYAAGDEAIRLLALKDDNLLESSMEILNSVYNKPQENEDKHNVPSKDPLKLASALTQLTVSTIIESITYLSIHFETKQALVEHNSGAWLKTLVSFANSNNRAIRHGLIQILLNMTMSVEDRKKLFESEVEQLKRVAQRGLMKKQNKEREFMEERAGSVEVIDVIRDKMVSCGTVKAVSDCFAIHRVQTENDTENLKFKKESAESDVPAHLRKPSNTEIFQESSAAIVCNIVTGKQHRGFVVQQGGLRLLLDLNKCTSEKAQINTAVAIARILITTNPNMVQENVLPGIIVALIKVLQITGHELYQFEILMALTNIASMNEEMRTRIMNAKGWSAARENLASDNFQCQRAALELMANLSMCDAAFEKLLENGDQDIRLFVLFSKTDDIGTVRATSGMIAMIAHHPDLARTIQKHGGVSVMKLLQSHEDEEVQKRAKIALEELEKHNITEDLSVSSLTISEISEE